MKQFYALLACLLTVVSASAITLEPGKVYTIANRNDNNLYVQDNGGDGPIAMGAKNDNSLWILEDAGEGHFYVKNFTTGRYAQECSTSAEVSVKLGNTPVAYSIVDCSAQEGADCFGLTSTNQSVTNFTADCIGWNWKGDNTVQTFAAVAGTNHRSFWKITEAPTSVTLDKSNYEVGDPVVVTYINTPGGATDWIAIYSKNQTPGNGVNSSTWRYVSGKSGQMTLNVDDAENWSSAIVAGEYYVAYLLNNGYEEGLDRTPFTVNPNHHYVNGVCTDDGCTDKYEPAELVDGKFLVKNAGNIEWMGVKIANGEKYDGSKNYNQATYEMQNDIDFTGVAHTPIGPDDAHKFNGVFDGKGHKISNMKVEAANAGMFCWLRGGTTIKNLTLDATCSFKGTDRAGSFACVTQVRGDGTLTVNLINCVNYASVTSQNKIASGLIAACNWKNDDEPTVNIINCVNAGNVTCTGNDNTVAFYGWSKSAGGTKVNVINSYNTGTLNKVDGDKRNLVRASNMGNVTITNSYDLTTSADKCGQGAKTWNTAAPLSSGELCYALNENVDSRAYTFKQTLEVDAMPLPKETGDVVYQAGTIDCSGQSVGGVTYNNVSGETIKLPHAFAESGICSKCNGFQEPELVDDWYEIKNAGNLEWYSAYINADHLQAKGKLMNDIDMLGIENLHEPIGHTEAQKFNGTFDGQGNRIKNLIINRPDKNYQGVFGFFRGNAYDTTVKNLIIDKSCSIHGNNRIGALVGGYQNGGQTITIENVVNEAEVIAEGQDAAAFIGGHVAGNPTIIIKNCVNTGSVTAKHVNSETQENDGFAGALCCYLGLNQETSKIENFLNLGTINGHLGGNIGRHNVPEANIINLIDLSDTEDKTQGVVEGLTPADAENGKVAYMMGFKQLIGTDEYPSPFGQAEVYNMTVSEAGYATYVAPVNVAVPTGVEAYTAKVNGNWIVLNKVTEIPEGEAVVLKNEGEFYFNAAASAAAIEENELVAATEDVTANGTQYILAKNDGAVAFYKAKPGTTIAAGKAYLVSESNINALYFEGDETGINDVNDNVNVNDNVYNLAGQRIAKMQRGINIVNGKKIIK